MASNTSLPATASATRPRSVLVLYAHSSPHQSRVNRKLADAARLQDGVQVHELYETYPDFFIDVAAEQARAQAADMLVFLHPLQWYSMPALMKEWIDAVLLPGWAYGQDGHALAGKTFLLAVTTGSPAEAYAADQVHGRPFDDYLPAFRQTAQLCRMQWAEPHVLHGAHHVDDAAVEAHVEAFVRRLNAFIDHADGAPSHATQLTV